MQTIKNMNPTFKQAIHIWQGEFYYKINSYLCDFYNKYNNVYCANIEEIDLGGSCISTVAVIQTLLQNMHIHNSNTPIECYRIEYLHYPVKGKSFIRPTFASAYKTINANKYNSIYVEEKNELSLKNIHRILIHKNVKYIELKDEYIIEPNTFWKFQNKPTILNNGTILQTYEVFPFSNNEKLYKDICYEQISINKNNANTPNAYANAYDDYDLFIE